MNRIYRLVFNAVTGQWAAVGECARGRGKRGSLRDGRIAAVLTLASAGAFAAPEGGTISAGSGSIAHQGATTNVHQYSAKLSVDWQSFNVKPGETVNFVQPSASAIALNRVLGAEASQILGRINANGQVFLLNPNGVLFGKGAEVNVGGMVASTLSLSDADFLAGNYAFTRNGGAGSVVNEATLSAADGGYIALLAPQVRNEGIVSARLGTALLAAGDKVTLTLDGGSLAGYQIDQGTLNALVQNKQLIQADGGRVFLAAKAAASELAKAVVNNEGVIEARTLNNRGGVIQLMGDMDKGEVKVAGTLDASAPNGGNGGFIETSAAKVSIDSAARITTKAAAGATGTWLIDPQDYTIAASGGDITGAALSAQLANNNVIIQSANGAAAGNGDIFVNDGVTWNANTLTLRAHRNITINTAMNGSGTAGLALEYGQGAVAAGNTADYFVNAPVNLASTGSFSTRLGSDGLTKNYTIVTSLGTETSSNDGTLQGMKDNLSGNFVLGANIDAAATATWNGGQGFNPIGTAINPMPTALSGWAPFTAAFDGLGHTISNLRINRPAANAVGLFGAVSRTGTIRHVGLQGGMVTGQDSVGPVVGWNAGAVSRAYATTEVVVRRGGGLVGWNAGTLDRVYATGSVNCAADDGASCLAGGLAGANGFPNLADLGFPPFDNSVVSITNAYATGAVSATGGGDVGGLVGLSYARISDSHATGDVTGTESATGTTPDNLGGLVGTTHTQRSGLGTVTRSYATGNVRTISDFARTTGGQQVGGLVGQANAAISESFATGAVSGRAFVGGLVGWSERPITRSFATGSVSVTEPSAPAVAAAAGGLVGLTNATGASIAESYATGAVSGSAGANLGGLIGINNSSIDARSAWDVQTTGLANAVGLPRSNSSSAAVGLTTAQLKNPFALIDRGWDFATVWGKSQAGNNNGYMVLRSLDTTAYQDYARIASTNLTRTYGDGISPNLTVDGVGAANVNLAWGSAITSTTNAGTYAYSSPNALAVTNGAGRSTYVDYGTGALTVTPRVLSLSGSRIYDGSIDIGASLLSLSNLASGEALMLSGSGQMADKNAGTGKTLTLGSLALGNGSGLASNYTLVGGTHQVDISRATLNVSGITTANKTFDGTNTARIDASAASLVGLMPGDQVHLAPGITGQFADTAPANGKPIQLTGVRLAGPDADNYTLVTPTLSASVSPANLDMPPIPTLFPQINLQEPHEQARRIAARTLPAANGNAASEQRATGLPGLTVRDGGLNVPAQ